MSRVIIIGGGASGFFTAINAKEQYPELEITILERGKDVLQKVKISGGGRCNVTHACFTPRELTAYYPRGEKELLGPFHSFMTGDIFEWFENRGLPLNIEEDGRAFPHTNSSQSVIDCFQDQVDRLGIEVKTSTLVTDFFPDGDEWIVKTKEETYTADKLVVAAGSSKTIWSVSDGLQHVIVPPVPSLFTFKIKDDRLTDLGGISVPAATVSILNTKLQNDGPLLITHWGLSGPAVLKLSAYGARILADLQYRYDVEVNWLSRSLDAVGGELKEMKHEHARKQIGVKSPFSEIPRRLWERLLVAADIPITLKWADVNKVQMQGLAQQLTQCVFHANGKSTFKEEFVTAGGIDLKGINFKTFESKLHPNLYFVGEVLNIDAVTGGFNFQNAWTSGYLCAQNLG